MTIPARTRRRQVAARLGVGAIALGVITLGLVAPGPGANGPGGGVPVASAAARMPLLIPPGILPGSGGSGGTAPAPGAALLLPAEPHMALWKTLARVTPPRDEEGGEPGFHASIRALVDTEIEITGYIMPLETGETQKHFLLSPFPHNCPFCATLGPESLVEVFCAQPIRMTFKAVTLKGRFNLAGFYADNGVYYRLTEAGLPTDY